MKVFLDVGAHVGETLLAVLDPKYRFDRIICFEPASGCQEALARFQDPRITMCRFGLWKETTHLRIFDPGRIGASIFQDKIDLVDGNSSELAWFVRASDWFRDNVQSGDDVYVKMNCEGAECDILDDLMDSDEISKVRSLLVAFDVREVPSQQGREVEVWDRLRNLDGLSVWSMDEFEGQRVGKVQVWLDRSGASEYATLGPMQRARSTFIHLRYVVFPAKALAPRSWRLIRRVLTPQAQKKFRYWVRGYRSGYESGQSTG
jgi:FkbM family methyltransferase